MASCKWKKVGNRLDMVGASKKNLYCSIAPKGSQYVLECGVEATNPKKRFSPLWTRKKIKTKASQDALKETGCDIFTMYKLPRY